MYSSSSKAAPGGVSCFAARANFCAKPSFLAAMAAIGSLNGLDSADAQQALPTINVGGGVRRAPARQGIPSTLTRTPAPAAATLTPVAQSRAPEKPFSKAIPDNIPAVVQTITAKQIEEQVNATTAIETLRYLPSMDISAKFPGDRFQSMTGRAIGPFEPQRALVYKDGILLSALFGTSEHTPKYSMIIPDEISRVDVIYGPYSALYSGNAIGGVVIFTTKMPERFDLHTNMQGVLAPYRDQYATFVAGPGYTGGLSIGDRHNGFSWRASYNHLLTNAQPVSYVTSSNPGGAAGLPAFGGFFDLDRQGALRGVFGTGQLQTTAQDVGVAKLAYDFNKYTRASYTIGVMSLTDNVTPETYLRDQATGLPAFNTPNGRVSLNGISFPLSGLNPAHIEYMHLMQGVEFKTETGGLVDFHFTGSSYDILRDVNVGATRYGVNTAGQTRELSGSNWKAMDLRGVWCPRFDFFGKHEVSFGAHYDQYDLKLHLQTTPTYWSSYYLQQFQRSYGKTRNEALYVQDVWRVLPAWTVTLGGRQEFWQAFDGFNEDRLGTGVRQAPRDISALMPKASLAWQATPEFLLRGSYGNFTRFPGVTELYQRAASPSGIIINSPDLKPEQGDSYELAAEYALGKNTGHLAYFHEDRWDGVVSQTDITRVPNVTNFSNVGKIRYNGVEGAVGLKHVFIDDFDADANATYTTSEILANEKNTAYVGKDMLQMPRWRAKLVGTYHPTRELALSAGFRYASSSYGQLNNYDWNHETFGGYGRWINIDARAVWKFAPCWTAIVGVNNINNYKRYLFAPYPQRTFFAELKYDFGGEAAWRREEQHQP